ncbi:hypothetical protein [Candidatus Symbiobacter mobilis]|uniref:Phage-Barnase-EndoU-ColicinE5/D-RelE-like nuclease domain-containing protein n=1 Tax=Candidatus Symbiobacter mobilis CR TaxID=946483 RepID=U5N8C9_9BURK|nr:hypothetical protein [Candidatus Symbiobacter mobilis]AGX87657.1 hypothetical protein Cenrod_1572 [Candidatus Symbiobacter mobilis CR]
MNAATQPKRIVLFLKGGEPGGKGLSPKVVTDKNGRRVTHWVRAKSGEEAKPPGPFNANESGPFGPILRQYRHDAQGAIEALTALQDGEAVAALYHPEVGDIDLVWGRAGTSRSDGSGLSKLLKWHPEVLNDLQGFISSLTIRQRDKKVVQLWDGRSRRAAVKLTYDEKQKHWLLTAFEKDGSGSGRITSPDTDTLRGKGDTARLSSIPTESVRQDTQGSNPKGAGRMTKAFPRIVFLLSPR